MLFKRKSPYGQYPCEVFLHNALQFLSEQNYDEAYSEICWALLKSGAELRTDERTLFDGIESFKRRIDNG